MEPGKKKSAGDGKVTSVTIFVVDDDPTIRDLVTIILGTTGIAFRVFANGEETLAAFKAAHPKPKLLITDYNMGGMNGLQLIEQCRKEQAGLKTILMSGTVDDSVLERFPVKAGIFLSKPFRAHYFIQSVKAVLAK